MELNIGKVSYEGQWFDFGNGRVKIRPLPATKLNFTVRDGGTMIAGEQSFDRFRYSLEAWENFTTPAPDLKPIDLTDEVKRKLFDFRVGSAVIDGQEVALVDFVAQKAQEILAGIQSAEKN